MLTHAEALELLRRMQAAAPAPIAAKLRDIAALLHSLPATAPLVEPPAPATDELFTDSDVLLLQVDEAIRPNLTTVKALAEGVLAGTFGNLNAEQAEHVETIGATLRSAIGILDSVQQMLAIQRGVLEVAPLVFSTTLLLRDVEREVQADVFARELELSVSLAPGDLRAVGDYPRIRRILLDLLENAIHYSMIGTKISLSAENLGTHVLFSVEDNGIGLSEDDLTHIGETFWRALHQPLVRQRPGTGLRLHLARELLALQDGELIFSGEAGVGSTFSFTLPVGSGDDF